MTTADVFLVGGFVRDTILGRETKDIDMSVVLHDVPLDTDALVAFNMMLQMIIDAGLEVFVVTPDKFTVRAAVPKGHPLQRLGSRTADFVLARKDGPYSDGRRPDWVAMGTRDDDLQRRDFTVNAMAQEIGYFDERGGLMINMDDIVNLPIIDLFNGLTHLRRMQLVFVGDPVTRIREDALRIMRAFRFCVTKGFHMAEDTKEAICTPEAAELLANISEDRRKDELVPMFRQDTLGSLRLINEFPYMLQEAMFADRLRLEATLAQ